ncbi:MAG TPA: ankyrin repeat domain-containing protein [Chthonomonadaceae bacterium]|nr:ankyrin repeat domain-containing protein [Chthonomonadaceae bacterium]
MRRRGFNLIANRMLLAALVAGLVWTLYRPIRQQWLNHALIVAVKAGDVENVKGLLDQGASTEARSRAEPYTPADAFREAISGHPNPYLGLTPLMLACISGREDIAQLLLQRGARVEDRDSKDYGATALIYAAAYNHPRLVALLIQHGANVNVNEGGWRTASSATTNKQIQQMLKQAGSAFIGNRR